MGGGETHNGSQWLPVTVWLPTFFKISSSQKNETHTGLEQLVGE